MLPTKEQASYFLPFVQALAEGKSIQFKKQDLQEWIDVRDCHARQEDFFTKSDYNIYDFRIKPEPKPPTYRPWKPEEVPVGALVRRIRMIDVRGLILAVIANECNNDIVIFDNKRWSYKNLLADIEHSTDNGKTWLPCGVLVTQEEKGE